MTSGGFQLRWCPCPKSTRPPGGVTVFPQLKREMAFAHKNVRRETQRERNDSNDLPHICARFGLDASVVWSRSPHSPSNIAHRRAEKKMAVAEQT